MAVDMRTTASLPWRVLVWACLARTSALSALPAFWRVMLEISSSVAEVSSTLAAWELAPSARDWLEPDTWADAPRVWVEAASRSSIIRPMLREMRLAMNKPRAMAHRNPASTSTIDSVDQSVLARIADDENRRAWAS